MVELDFRTLSGPDAYRWLIRLIVPRPIGWVSTCCPSGVPNLAPFSWFQTMCTAPPLLAVACGDRRDEAGRRQLKDTFRNVKDTGECVIQLAERSQIEALVATSAGLPYGESEFGAAGLTPVASQRVRPPRVAGARVAFECVIEELIEREHWKTRLIFARVLSAHIDPALVRPDGSFRDELWRPIARLGGDSYAELGARFDLPRPS